MLIPIRIKPSFFFVKDSTSVFSLHETTYTSVSYLFALYTIFPSATNMPLWHKPGKEP